MNKKNLNKIEYFKVLEHLSQYSKTFLGKKKCLTLQPSYTKSEVEYLLQQTTQATISIEINGAIPLDEIDNIFPFIKQLEANACLSTKALLSIARILKMSREIILYFKQLGSKADLLSPISQGLFYNEDIEKMIFSKILDENSIDDMASQKLYTIRKNIKKLNVDIKTKLSQIIHSGISKYLQDSIVTVKNDRFVIPVKDEYRSKVDGFIHDTSSSGSTLFIEPISIFNMNNELNKLKLDEEIEITRILYELSSKLFAYAANLENNLRIIETLDCIFAKANYSKTLNCICPIINSEKQINLEKIRHPLIPSEKVIPIDIYLGYDFTSLVITGPNTGGKTVSLKTVGLACAMAQTGLHIPAKDGTSLYIFDNIFCDIGDEQSIAESLSTFSSHIKNIVDIINLSTSNSLILLDELGSGTDPLQGSALAISILDHFYKKNCLTISTTHYSELKNFALTTNGFSNASFEFDVETLSPTYKLIIGLPGKSNAFEISKKLGLEKSILEKAYNLLDCDSINIEDILKEIYYQKAEIEKEKNEIDKNLHQVELLRKQLANELEIAKTSNNDLIEKAKIEARNILLSAKDDATMMIRKLKELETSANLNYIKTADKIRNDLNTRVRELSKSSISKDYLANNNINERDIKVGLEVFVIPFNKNGIILSLPNSSNEIQVQLGTLKTKIKLYDIVILKEKNKNSNHIKLSNKTKSTTKTINPEINVIGLTVDEALYVIDKYIDDALLSNLNQIRIVHGKGTGKLRNGIHSFLKNHSRIKNFRLGTFGEGEMGVTIVEIKT